MRIRVDIGQGWMLEHTIDDNPLGLRWWTRGGTGPWDKLEGTIYGQTRCVPLDYADMPWGGSRLLCAMEVDGSIQAFSPHGVFPILEQTDADRAAADEFARAVIQRHALEPTLL